MTVAHHDADGEGAVDPHDPWHVVHQGYTVLVTRSDGTFSGVGREGLFDYDTRVLSAYRLVLDGTAPERASSGVLGAERWCGVLRAARSGGRADGPELPQDALELTILRRVGRGMSEELRIANHSMVPVATQLVLHLDADFADVQHLDSHAPGKVQVTWEPERRALLFAFLAERDGRLLRRALRVLVARSDSPPTHADRTLTFAIRLRPKQEWSAALGYHSLVDDEWREPSSGDPAGERPDERQRLRERWSAERTTLDREGGIAAPAFERAAADLFALRNWEYDDAPDAWFPIAGVPTYTGVFGRDSLTAAWQGALLGPEMMRGALAVIARTQAATVNDFRDQEPGKLIHEMRRGPFSELDILPHRAYYGSQTTPAMFVLALSEYWHWTGDDSLLRRHRETALRTFEWADRFGDPDDDGFLEYERRSEAGLKNQGWKDSDEAIRYPDGTLVPNPIATIEEQAYHYIALQRMAEILLVLDEEQQARLFLERARELGRRLDRTFWMEEEGFYAMALDPQKDPVRTIASNSGHALAAGVVPDDRAERVAARLLEPDMFSGWGVRSLSTEHPSYNPWGYHLGTVWPVENATFALGMKRYGLDAEAGLISASMLEATAHFRFHRLPEALSGHSRGDSPMPSAYPGSNSPQAWSASATVQLVQVMLGIYPFAAAKIIALVRPTLPAWLPVLTLRHVRVGSSVVSLRFERRDDGYADHEVIEKEGTIHVVTFPPPQDVRPDRRGATDGLKAWFLAHARGRTAAALRVALGEMDV